MAGSGARLRFCPPLFIFLWQLELCSLSVFPARPQRVFPIRDVSIRSYCSDAGCIARSLCWCVAFLTRLLTQAKLDRYSIDTVSWITYHTVSARACGVGVRERAVDQVVVQPQPARARTDLGGPRAPLRLWDAAQAVFVDLFVVSW